MTEFLTSISDFFAAIGGIALNIVNGLVYLVTLIPQAIAYSHVVLGYLPAPVMPFAFCVIAISVIFLILGR